MQYLHSPKTNITINWQTERRMLVLCRQITQMHMKTHDPVFKMTEHIIIWSIRTLIKNNTNNIFCTRKLMAPVVLHDMPSGLYNASICTHCGRLELRWRWHLLSKPDATGMGPISYWTRAEDVYTGSEVAP